MSPLALSPSLLAATGFDYALQQPLFPGKILLWGLFMLSLLSWGVMVSKGITLFRMRRSDEDFSKRFRATRQPLQMFERNFEDDLSLRWVIYDHGAREAAFQMLGSPDRDATFAARLRACEGLTPIQMKAVREALGRGEMAAAAKLKEGIPVLSLTSLGAPFLGLLGLAWILMKTFSQRVPGDTLTDLSPGVSGALAMLVVGLLVATPALVGQIVFGALSRDRLRKLGDFRSEVGRSIEHFYAAGSHEVPLSLAATQSSRTSVHHAQPGAPSPYGPVGDFDGQAIEQAASSLEAGADALSFGGGSPFVLIDEGAEAAPDRPIAAYANPEDDLPPEGQGYLFRTPFVEAEVNPVARHATAALGRQVALA